MMSKIVGNKRNGMIALASIIIVLVAGVAVCKAQSGQIQIPANGVVVSNGGLMGVGGGLNVTVDNTGSVPVTITTIYVNGGTYPSENEPSGDPNTFWPATCFGAPCSDSNGIINGVDRTYNMTVYIIQPAQSIIFTVAFGVPLQHGTVTVKVVGSNGAEATAQTTW